MSVRVTVASQTKRSAMQAGASLVRLAGVLPEGIVLLDADWRLIYANQNARLIHAIEDRHFHCSQWDIWPELLGTPLEAACRRVMTGRAAEHVEAFVSASRALTLDLHLFPVDGGIAICSRDVTREHTLRDARIDTEQRIRTALIQSEKLAAIGRMAASIAHEINNPLESVTNLLFLAQQHVISPEAKHYLLLADQELGRINIIANQTLRFHKQAAVPRSISPEALFATVLNLYEGRLRNSGIIVRRRMQPDVTFACFEGDVRQVLNNLVSNAIDAMPNGGILQLRSHRTRHPDTGRLGVTLTVADTGTGIAAEDQPRIFDAFFTTRGSSRNGLGLWISKGILELQQGFLRVRSRCGTASSGTVFSVFLPAAMLAPSPAPLPAEVPFVTPLAMLPPSKLLSN